MRPPRLEWAAAWLAEPKKLRLGGYWTEGRGALVESVNPATGQVISQFRGASEADIDAAVRAARAAFASGVWSGQGAIKERGRAMRRIADLIRERQDELATLETLDNGRLYSESWGDAEDVADLFDYYSGWVDKHYGEVNPVVGDFLSYTVHQPVGVVAQIVPWNFPFLMAAWKLAPVLAAGCCTVFKPSSLTSLSVLELARLIGDVLPPGVFNVVTGKGSKSGQYILDHEGFRKLAFTGSTEVGCAVANAASSRLIPSTLELGGKSANIYFPDAQWDMAMDGLQLGILFNQGQVCCAGSRVFVHEDIYDRFVADAVEQFKRIKVGVPWDPSTQMGSQVDMNQLNQILGWVEEAKSEGATVAVGGARAEGPGLENGAFMQPTLIVDVTNDMKVAQEEIFGPVAVVIKFSTEQEVIAMANDSVYGLGGAVWTRDINRAIRVARAIETGRVWINTYNAIPAGAPFGGYKASGIGRETHKVILEHYTQQKNIMVNLSEAPSGFYPAG
jgi:acyl-CoA reductase-like NAD-dependent aldehyde dehydrogenase